MAQLFKINLKDAHDKTGLSFYMVAKRTGIALNTVKKYALKRALISPYIPTAVVVLAEFYGVDWRAPEIIEVIEEEGDPTPESEAAFTAA